MKGHRQVWPFINLDELKTIIPANLHPTAADRLLVCSTCCDGYPPCDTYAALTIIEEAFPV